MTTEDKAPLQLISFHKYLKEMEECYHVFLTPTGFGSVFLAIFSVVRPGDEIIVADPTYSPTRILTQDFLKEFNIKTTFYNPHDLKTLEKNITKKTKLIFVENPGSNSFEFQDLGKIISIAKKNKIYSAIDNTWGTPYFLNQFHWVLICQLFQQQNIIQVTLMLWVEVLLLIKKFLKMLIRQIKLLG